VGTPCRVPIVTIPDAVQPEAHGSQEVLTFTKEAEAQEPGVR
jgi:hypothetical protein